MSGFLFTDAMEYLDNSIIEEHIATRQKLEKRRTALKQRALAVSGVLAAACAVIIYILTPMLLAFIRIDTDIEWSGISSVETYKLIQIFAAFGIMLLGCISTSLLMYMLITLKSIRLKMLKLGGAVFAFFLTLTFVFALFVNGVHFNKTSFAEALALIHMPVWGFVLILGISTVIPSGAVFAALKISKLNMTMCKKTLFMLLGAVLACAVVGMALAAVCDLIYTSEISHIEMAWPSPFSFKAEALAWGGGASVCVCNTIWAFGGLILRARERRTV